MALCSFSSSLDLGCGRSDTTVIGYRVFQWVCNIILRLGTVKLLILGYDKNRNWVCTIALGGCGPFGYSRDRIKTTYMAMYSWVWQSRC